jgi:Uma2 family endonuclease
MTLAERHVLHRWTSHEYQRLIDHGFLDEDDPIELLDGLLLVKEPQHSLHRTAVLLVAKAVERAFGEGWFVQTQSPIILDGRSEPEPDVCVVRGSPRDYIESHPTRPALIVEVAQAGLSIARGRKAAAYARARISDYWLVNLIGRWRGGSSAQLRDSALQIAADHCTIRNPAATPRRGGAGIPPEARATTKGPAGLSTVPYAVCRSPQPL